jgi:hypothetical protein
MSLTLIIAIVVVVTLVLAALAIPRGKRDAVAVGARTPGAAGGDPEDLREAGLGWDDDSEARVVPRDQGITWPKMFDPRAGELSDAERLQLIEDLALVHAPWCVPILSKAYDEESSSEQRKAALRALTACDDDDARALLDRASNASEGGRSTIAASTQSAR